MPEARALSLEQLYGTLADELERIVQANVHAEPDLIQEACQNAWGTIVAHPDRPTPGAELGWLAVTATREALSLLQERRDGVSLDEQRERGRELVGCAADAAPERVAELHERLAEVRELPPRQCRVVMLQGFGYHYAEIARLTGCSRRTVERELLIARRRLAG